MMKSFKTYIREVALGTGSSGIARYNDELHRVSEEDVKARVNTWLQANSNMEFHTVEAALYQLSAKLEQLGISFQQTEAAGNSGSLRLPLKQYGEKHDHAGEHVLDVSIPEDLVMSVDYERMPTGGFRVTGQIQ
tara:strand:- start:58 stop:459 length:402 start_codon:yes stop_codon:yes gene_type:complete